MARRQLTRIELRMEDLQEYEQMKKQFEKRKFDGSEEAVREVGTPHLITSFKNRGNKEIVHERIGYNPAPRNPL